MMNSSLRNFTTKRAKNRPTKMPTRIAAASPSQADPASQLTETAVKAPHEDHTVHPDVHNSGVLGHESAHGRQTHGGGAAEHLPKQPGG